MRGRDGAEGGGGDHKVVCCITLLVFSINIVVKSLPVKAFKKRISACL